MNIKAKLLELLFPQDMKCPVCGAETAEGVCASCREKVKPFVSRITPDGLDGFTAGLQYGEAVREVVHRFKYGNASYLAHFLSSWIQFPDEWADFVIVPVPLHPSKLRERGYNQSELLSRELSLRSGFPVQIGWMRRIRNTGTQTELSVEERRRNVQNAFSAAPACKGSTILLIDDVCTTGSTLSACAHALRIAGASAVYGASAAVTTEDSLT